MQILAGHVRSVSFWPTRMLLFARRRPDLFLRSPEGQTNVQCEPLIERLVDEDDNVRLEAGQGIIRLPRCWSAALPNVQKLFQRTEQDVAIAAHLIERMGPLASTATERLLDTIEKRPDSREQLASALSHIGPSVVEPVISAVRNNRIDIEIGKGILKFASGESVLMRIVSDAEPADRIIAAKMLGAAKPVKHASIDCLVDGITSEDAEMRMACVLGLGSMGMAAKSAEPAVRAAAESDLSESVQAAALTTLFKIGVEPESLASAIVAGLSHDNLEIRRECTRAMRRFETLDANQIDALLATIADSDVVVRTSVLEALANVAEPSSELIGKLVGVLDDPERDVRSAAYNALATFGKLAAPAVPQLTERLNEDASRLPVMRTLAAIGPAADAASGPVKTFLGNESSEVRATSVETLGKIMVNRAELIEIVTDRLADDDWAVRKKSAELLGAEGEAAIGAVPALIDLLQKEDDSDYARNALRGIDAAPPEAIPQLVAILAGNSGRRARFYAMHLLKKVGPAAKQAVPELREILDQEKYDSRTQRYLEQVIEDIEDQEEEARDSENQDEG